MPGHTPRLNLYQPGGGTEGTHGPDEQADIDRINDDFLIVDGAVGAPTATSGTRPATPYDGELIYESDTKNIKVFSTSDGTWHSPSSSARGLGADYVVTTPAALHALTAGGALAGDTAYLVGDAVNFDHAIFTFDGVHWKAPFVQFLLNTTAAFAAVTTYLNLGVNVSIQQAGGMGIVSTTAQVAVYNPANTLWALVSQQASQMTAVATGAGQSSSVNPGGEVVFGSALTLQVTNCFPVGATLADKFRAIIDVISMAAAGSVSLQLTAAGVPVTAGYDVQLFSSSGAVAPASANPLNAAQLGLSNSNTTQHLFDILFARPNVVGAAGTAHAGTADSFDYQNPMTAGGAIATRRYWSQRTNGTAYDGFLLTFSTAATGTLNVAPLTN